MAFFQDCWDIVYIDLVDLFHEFHLNGDISISLNATSTLIPKRFEAVCIQDYRPSNLIYAPYKIIAKILSNGNPFSNARGD